MDREMRVVTDEHEGFLSFAATGHTGHDASGDGG